MTARSKLVSFVFLCVAAACGVAAALVWAPKPPELGTGTLLAPSRVLADFSLIDNKGRSFEPANLQGHWSFMFSATDSNYTVDPSSAIFVVDPAGNLAAILNGPFTVDTLQSHFKRIVAGPA